MSKEHNLYFIGFLRVHSSFRPVSAENLNEAKQKFAKFHNVKLSNDIGASRDFKEMTKRYNKLIK